MSTASPTPVFHLINRKGVSSFRLPALKSRTTLNTSVRACTCSHFLRFILHLLLMRLPLPLSPTMKKVSSAGFTKRVFNWCRRMVPRAKLRRSLKGKVSPTRFICHRYDRILRRARTICRVEYLRGCVRLNAAEPTKQVPKGHIAVCVGGKGEEARRVLVPVIFFNHPLFGDLLQEADEMYGHHHHGRITFPCQMSEFEVLKRSVAAMHDCQNPAFKRHPSCMSRR